jgi:hypothetical protein
MTELFDVPGMLLGDDRLGRALEAFAPVAEAVRGAMALRAAEAFQVDASRLHLDLTTVRFTGAYEDSSLVAKGWGADRRVARQVRTLQAATADGVPLYFRPHKGSTAELTALGAALERLRELLPAGLVVVADSALGHPGNLCTADRAGLRFVVPLRADTGWAEVFKRDVGDLAALRALEYVAQRQQRLPPEERTRWRGLLRDFPLTDPASGRRHDLRVAYIWSSEEAATVAGARERALTKAEDTLTRVRNGLGGRYYKTREQVDAKVVKTLGANVDGLLLVTTGQDDRGKPTLSWRRDHDAITAAARLDGLYALATNLPEPKTALAVLRIYKDQWVVEQRHRDLKQTLKVRPVFLHNDDRIDALVGIVGLALLVFGLIEADLRRRLAPDILLPGLLPEGRAAKPTGRNILAAFQHLGLTHTPGGPVLDRLSHTQQTILDLLGIPLPWPQQPS